MINSASKSQNTFWVVLEESRSDIIWKWNYVLVFKLVQTERRVALPAMLAGSQNVFVFLDPLDPYPFSCFCGRWMPEFLSPFDNRRLLDVAESCCRQFGSRNVSVRLTAADSFSCSWNGAENQLLVFHFTSEQEASSVAFHIMKSIFNPKFNYECIFLSR